MNPLKVILLHLNSSNLTAPPRPQHPLYPPIYSAPVTPLMEARHCPLCHPSLISGGLYQGQAEEKEERAQPPLAHQTLHHHPPHPLSNYPHYWSCPQQVTTMVTIKRTTIQGRLPTSKPLVRD